MFFINLISLSWINIQVIQVLVDKYLNLMFIDKYLNRKVLMGM
jgi:hypothetical protein